LGASDVHLNPALDAFEARWRLDAVLQPLVEVSKDVGPDIIDRLNVLSGLLAYDTSSPREGRIRDYSLNVEVPVIDLPPSNETRTGARI
jgi:type II secretory ATPase GspE/PulE/Tfp pilus assembly ATPase PilB-like protein